MNWNARCYQIYFLILSREDTRVWLNWMQTIYEFLFIGNKQHTHYAICMFKVAHNTGNLTERARAIWWVVKTWNNNQCLTVYKIDNVPWEWQKHRKKNRKKPKEKLNSLYNFYKSSFKRVISELQFTSTKVSPAALNSICTAESVDFTMLIGTRQQDVNRALWK